MAVFEGGRNRLEAKEHRWLYKLTKDNPRSHLQASEWLTSLGFNPVRPSWELLHTELQDKHAGLTNDMLGNLL